jgi:hypothetical protein
MFVRLARIHSTMATATTAIKSHMIIRLVVFPYRDSDSELVEGLNPFDEFAFTDTPLMADLESGQFSTLNQAF